MTNGHNDENDKYLSTKFVIRPGNLERQGRSLSLLLLDRRCGVCKSALAQEELQGSETTAAKHLEQIGNHCSKNQDFIYPGLPLNEAMFRVLLSGGNRPMELGKIYDALEDRWSDASSRWTPLPDRLFRMLSRDIFYGIAEVGDS